MRILRARRIKTAMIAQKGANTQAVSSDYSEAEPLHALMSASNSDFIHDTCSSSVSEAVLDRDKKTISTLGNVF